jgi:oligoendopeptidase F
MRAEDLLDLDSRLNKAPGGYCNYYLYSKRPFIFTNAVGIHDDVQTLLHEGGHAFHVFEFAHRPFFFLDVPSEFAEVASMAMEMLASPYLLDELGGFYSSEEAARARIQHLESMLLFWPYMAVVDAFQQWVYENQGAALIPENCDSCWVRLWERFMPGVDWSGFEEDMRTCWQRKLHIFEEPFSKIEELESKTSQMFRQVDPQLGDYFEIMRAEDLLDLDSRLNKAPGGYCNYYLYSKRPFIFTNAVGVHDDVQTLLHEGGHAFHVFEFAHRPFFFLDVPMEFAEVASMSMELLASPYLLQELGGFYSPEEAARARIQHLESMLLFWPYMAVVDAFQQWVYENQSAALIPENCDSCWARLWERFMPGVDWSGFEEEMRTGWQRKLHIFEEPFYYVEYGLAQLGAVQIWRNSLNDQAGAVTAYRQALSLGTSVTLPDLYSAAGANFAFDVTTVRQAVNLILETVSEFESDIK